MDREDPWPGHRCSAVGSCLTGVSRVGRARCTSGRRGRHSHGHDRNPRIRPQSDADDDPSFSRGQTSDGPFHGCSVRHRTAKRSAWCRPRSAGIGSLERNGHRIRPFIPAKAVARQETRIGLESLSAPQR